MPVHVRLAGLLAAAALYVSSARAVIRGVNLGSWLVTEPWMVPTLYNSTGAIDEWHLCNALGKEQCLATLQDHWSTFITRDDLVQIQAAGLTAVRIPLGYWAVDLLPYEPYVSGQYPFLIQAVQWAGELGLKVFIDLHGAPGSQNGWEETGLVGAVDFFGNTTNGARTLNVLKNLTTEFSKPIYGGVVTNIEPLNEPTLDYSKLRTWYTSAADVIGAGNSSGINLTISDAFYNPHSWQNYDPWNEAATTPAPHITVDTHQFWAFPPLDQLGRNGTLEAICGFATSQLRAAPQLGTPPTLVGEWSLSTGVTANSTIDAADDAGKRAWFRMLFEAQNAAYSPQQPGQAAIGWFFWSWKTDYNIDAWSYQKGVQLGYIPSNISDPKTYVFPLRADGCLDGSYNWTAPPLATQGSSTVLTAAVTSADGSGPVAGATSYAASTSPHKGAAAARPAVLGFAAEYGLYVWFGVAALSFTGMLL